MVRGGGIGGGIGSIGRGMVDVKGAFGDNVGIWGQSEFGEKGGKEGIRGKLGVCPADQGPTAPQPCEMCRPGSWPMSQAETFV